MVKNDIFEPREALRHNLAQLINSKENIKGSIGELSKLTGISRQGLSKLVKGNADNPGLDTLLTLSSVFGVTVSQLIGQLPLEAKVADYGVKNVPVLLWQQACRAKEVAALKNLGNWDDWIMTTISLSSAAYALRVETKHFEPYFYFGTTLIIDPEVEPADNDYIIIQSSDCEKARIKKIINDGNLWLHSLIQEHPPVELNNKKNGYELCGVVLQSITMYRGE